MEESLLLSPKQSEEKTEISSSSTSSSGSLTWSVFFQEMKKLGYIAAPLMAVILSQFLLQVISMMMVGHLGKLALSSSAIAISLSGVTGFSVLVSLFYFYVRKFFFLYFFFLTNLYLKKNQTFVVL